MKGFFKMANTIWGCHFQLKEQFSLAELTAISEEPFAYLKCVTPRRQTLNVNWHKNRCEVDLELRLPAWLYESLYNCLYDYLFACMYNCLSSYLATCQYMFLHIWVSQFFCIYHCLSEHVSIWVIMYASMPACMPSCFLPSLLPYPLSLLAFISRPA